MQNVGRGEIQIRPSKNGSVEITLKLGNRDALISLSPDEASGIASHILTAANAAFIQTGKDDAAAQKKFQGPVTPPVVVPVSSWHFGPTNQRGQHIIIVRCGESALCFGINEGQMRDIGRLLVRGSWTLQSTLRLRPLLALLLSDFWADLKAWGGVFNARFKASSRRLAISFWSTISGRSFRLFRAIKITPEIEPPDYPPVGKCIYCGSEVYSDRPGFRRFPLGAEHIIAEGLGGKLELPEASCQRCEDITGRLVEGDILLRTLKAFRMHLKIRGKRKSSKPATLPLSVTVDNRDQVVQIPIEDYPVIFNMPAFGSPPVFIGGSGGNQLVFGFRLVLVNYNANEFTRKYGYTTFASPHWDTHMFFRMLGKIGHSFAVAELGQRKFVPLLTDMILKGSPELFNHIGGEPDLARDPTSDALHELGLGYQRANGKNYVVAKIRLFAKQMGPIYYVVVGTSLETPMARAKRVFSRRISRMLAR
jgi:hypothetical protein